MCMLIKKHLSRIAIWIPQPHHTTTHRHIHLCGIQSILISMFRPKNSMHLLFIQFTWIYFFHLSFCIYFLFNSQMQLSACTSIFLNCDRTYRKNFLTIRSRLSYKIVPFCAHTIHDPVSIRRTFIFCLVLFIYRLTLPFLYRKRKTKLSRLLAFLAKDQIFTYIVCYYYLEIV